ncbi:MAG: type I polyketide synthase [Gammaproteobacteria bacterium]
MSDATPSSQRSALVRAYRAIEKLEAELRAARGNEPIAIVGMGCRFPDANDPKEFWTMLRAGVDATREHPRERWNMDACFDPTPGIAGRICTRRGAYIEDVDRFDAAFFGIPPHEADCMDPQQRLVLETAWATLEDANTPPDRLRNSRTGAYIGMSGSDYALLAAKKIGFDPYIGLGIDPSALAGRLSYQLGLQGPSLTVATVCSSSLVAVHLACQALQARQCDLALAGGVHLNLAPESAMVVSLVQAISPDGRCKTFDAAADGYGRGEGCGLVALKRLADAESQGDCVYAVIYGSAVNHDGPSGGLTVPSGPAQEKVLREALAAAGIEPRLIRYVEAHGTGTSLGDPIEVKALNRVLGQGRSPKDPLLIGSVKTNIGHLEAASGVAGLMKVALALNHGEIPPHLHFNQPNPHIQWNDWPIAVPTECRDWPTGRKLAGVSSFGMTGTNAHLVIGEAPARPATREAAKLSEASCHFLALSGKTRAALTESAERYRAFLSEHPDVPVADLCFTALTGRNHFRHRLGVVARTIAEIDLQLDAFIGGREFRNCGESSNLPRTAFLFTGQGSQYAQMGFGLYERHSVFRQTIEQCDELLRPYLDRSLIALLFAREPDQSPLDETIYTQPALFAVEYALAQLWLSLGIQPDLMLGHSVGEIVAACLAGVFDLEHGLKLIAARGRLMQALPRDGAMLVAAADEARIAKITTPFSEEVSIAAFNGPQNIVISGRSGRISTIANSLRDAGIRITPLKVSHAFHSPCMEPMLAEFAKVARSIAYSRPNRKLISNLSGELAGEEIATSEYWVEHVRRPVRFAQGMFTLQRQGIEVFLEIGPKPTLLGMGRQCLEVESATNGDWLPSLRPGQEDEKVFLDTLARLFVLGAKLNQSGFEHDPARRKLRLPTYPFQRERHWLPEEEPKLRSQNRPRSLIERMVSSPLLAETLFETKLGLESHPFVTDHKIQGRIIFPAAGHLVLVLSAAELAFNTRVCQLEDVLFSEALDLTQTARRVQLVFRPESPENARQAASFELVSLPLDGDSVTVHVKGRVAVPVQCQTDNSSVESWQKACTDLISGAEIYARMEHGGSEWGPSFRWLVNAWWNAQGQSLGQLHKPESVPEPYDYPLHPGLLDGCFQLAGIQPAQADENSGTFVPFTIERFTLHRKAQSDLFWCHAEDAGARRWNMDLVENNGAVIAELRGYEIAEMPAALISPQPTWRNWLYETAWQPLPEQEFTRDEHRTAGLWLVFADSAGLGERLAQRLGAQGHTCILVQAGKTYRAPASGSALLNPDEADDCKRLIDDLRGSLPWRGVVYLWSTECTVDVDEVPEQARNHCQVLLSLVTALHQIGAFPRLWLVTRGAQAVIGSNDMRFPGTSPLWGLAQSLYWEHPELRCTALDLAPEAEAGEAENLCDELKRTSTESRLAFRNGRCYGARLLRASAPATYGRTFESDGDYLITGGFGALGLKSAEWLAERGAKRLILLGRSKPSAAACESIGRLSRDGVLVQTVQADVSDFNEIKHALAAWSATLRGVIHAAGVLRDGIWLQQTPVWINEVIRPKIHGAWHLHRLTLNSPLRFFICFSSTAAIFGSRGQANYAAANAFLDALAHYRRSAGLPALSIDWGSFAEIGMAARLSNKDRDRLQREGESLLPPAAGLEALEALIDSDRTQAGVVAMDWRAFFSTAAADEIPAFFSNFAPKRPIVATSRPNRNEVVAALGMTHRRDSLTRSLRKQAARSLGRSETQFDASTPLNLLGLDSLMAIDLRTTIRRDYGVDLPIAKLLEGLSVADLARLIDVELDSNALSDSTEPDFVEGEL